MNDTSQVALFQPAQLPGRALGKHLRMVDGDGLRVIFMGRVAINAYNPDDKAAESAAIAMLATTGVAKDVEIADAFGCHRNRVRRIERRLEDGGMAAVVPAKRGPRGPHKITDEVIAVMDDNPGLGATAMTRLIEERTGVKLSISHVHRFIAERRAADPQLPLVSDASDEPASTAVQEPAVQEPAVQEPAVQATRENIPERFEPSAIVPAKERGRYMGCALYYPALAALGLADAARRCFALPRSERFGVRAVVLTLFFLTLLRKPTVESAKHLTRREFGALVGTGRAPAVKTLRRKLQELVCQQATTAFSSELARRWVESGLVATSYLYVDGHMKPYSGKRELKDFWNSQRRMPLPGVMTYFVGDLDGRPLLFVNEDASSLAKAMPKVIAAIQDAVGDRPFTVIFDRGGYDGELFTSLTDRGIDFITYQKGMPGLPTEIFSRRETRFEGKRVRFQIAEDTVNVAGTGPWRRIVIRTKDGHQSPILTSITSTGPARIACLMFARWRQENFFGYMTEHHGLDHLVSYAYEDADPDEVIPNPERKRLDRVIAKLRKKARALTSQLGDTVLDEPRDSSRSAHGLKIAQKGAVKELRDIEDEIQELVAMRKVTPTHVRLADSGKKREVMRLEHKALVDRIKISAYNAEEWLLDLLARHYDNADDIRNLLRSFAELSGEIRHTTQGIEVQLDPPDTPKHRRALHGLCADLNNVGPTFPGTDLPVVYRVAMHYSEAAA